MLPRFLDGGAAGLLPEVRVVHVLDLPVGPPVEHVLLDVHVLAAVPEPPGVLDPLDHAAVLREGHHSKRPDVQVPGGVAQVVRLGGKQVVQDIGEFHHPRVLSEIVLGLAKELVLPAVAAEDLDHFGLLKGVQDFHLVENLSDRDVVGRALEGQRRRRQPRALAPRSSWGGFTPKGDTVRRQRQGQGILNRNQNVQGHHPLEGPEILRDGKRLCFPTRSVVAQSDQLINEPLELLEELPLVIIRPLPRCRDDLLGTLPSLRNVTVRHGCEVPKHLVRVRVQRPAQNMLGELQDIWMGVADPGDELRQSREPHRFGDLLEERQHQVRHLHGNLLWDGRPGLFHPDNLVSKLKPNSEHPRHALVDRLCPVLNAFPVVLQNERDVLIVLLWLGEVLQPRDPDGVEASQAFAISRATFLPLLSVAHEVIHIPGEEEIALLPLGVEDDGLLIQVHEVGLLLMTSEA
mmetsp:Transcript_4184/g.12198  ORF Transcript_4184/g.12198 Transcript_4184/m.12198 type:complete len:461 (+) Transcript_4184:763-2145(+)